MQQFPRTTVGGVSLPRLLIGTNWMLGWSHRSPSADSQIQNRYQKPEDFFPMFEAYSRYGIDATMGITTTKPVFADAIKYASDKLGREIILIDTPIINVDDSAQGRAEAAATIKTSAQNGAKFCLIHHSSCEQLVNKNKQIIARLEDYTYMIRENGMIPGLSAHMPEIIVYCDRNNYDVETYIQIYNALGFLMQVEVESVARTIHSAKKPVMTIKSMAAGRCTPYVGLNFVWNTLRDCDMVTLGASYPAEVHEDVEISFAALERRFPDLEGRRSPAPDQAAFGNK